GEPLWRPLSLSVLFPSLYRTIRVVLKTHVLDAHTAVWKPSSWAGKDSTYRAQGPCVEVRRSPETSVPRPWKPPTPSAPVLSDVQPSPCQSFRVVGHLQTTIRQNVGHLITGKQSEFMTLNVVLGPCWCANEVMHVHRGQPSLNEAGIDPGNLQVRFVNKSCMDRSWSPGLRGEPWLNE